MLLAMIGFAFVSAIVGAGVNGSALAYGIGVSICMLLIYFLCFALLHGFALLIAPRTNKVQANDVPVILEPEPTTEATQ